jgi:hypothetical protein
MGHVWDGFRVTYGVMSDQVMIPLWGSRDPNMKKIYLITIR